MRFNFAEFVDEIGSKTSPRVSIGPDGWTPEEVAEYVAERSAIMEFEGGLNRDMADIAAAELVAIEFEEEAEKTALGLHED